MANSVAPQYAAERTIRSDLTATADRIRSNLAALTRSAVRGWASYSLRVDTGSAAPLAGGTQADPAHAPPCAQDDPPNPGGSPLLA